MVIENLTLLTHLSFLGGEHGTEELKTIPLRDRRDYERKMNCVLHLVKQTVSYKVRNDCHEIASTYEVRRDD